MTLVIARADARSFLSAHTWRPAAVWRWHPLAVAAFVFAIDFGVLLTLRVFEHGAFFLPWGNKTFLIGDSVFLPLYAGLTAAVVRRGIPDGSLYHHRWWHLAVLGAGVGLALLMDLMTVAQGHTSIFVDFQLSKTYHTCVFGLLFYLLVSVLPLLRPYRSWAAALACLALACYLAIALVEIEPMAQQSLATVAGVAQVL